MGSFNTTCFVTQQTISERNPCYIFPIKQNSGYNGVKLTRGDKSAVGSSVASSTCYSDCFWKPVGGFIKATYADYGQVEIDFTDEENKKKVNALFKELSREVFVTHVGENECHDVLFNISDCKEKPIQEIWEYLWTAAVHELRVFMIPYQDNSPRQFTFAIISEQAYDYLLNSIETSKNYNGISNSRNTAIDGFSAAIEARMADFDTPDKHEGKYAEGGKGYDSMRSHIASEVIRRAIEGCSNVHIPFYLLDDSYSFSEEVLKEGKLSDENKAKVKSLMEFGYIMLGLDDMNIKISPMVYSGQDYSNAIGKAYAKMIKTVSAQITKQQKGIYND